MFEKLKAIVKAAAFYLFSFIVVLLSLPSITGLFLLVAIPLFLADRTPNKMAWGSLMWYSFDQMMNVQFAPLLNYWFKPKKHLFGHPDETLSSVFSKEKDINLSCRYVMMVLNKVDKNHDIKALESDEGFIRDEEKVM